jgi:hypothetical protein
MRKISIQFAIYFLFFFFLSSTHIPRKKEEKKIEVLFHFQLDEKAFDLMLSGENAEICDCELIKVYVDTKKLI